MNLPDKPTSGSWLADLQALAEMGATSVDIRTALGAVEEEREACGRLMAEATVEAARRGLDTAERVVEAARKLVGITELVTDPLGVNAWKDDERLRDALEAYDAEVGR